MAVKVSQFLKKGERGHAMDVTVERERVRGPWWSMVVDEVCSGSKRRAMLLSVDVHVDVETLDSDDDNDSVVTFN